MIISIIVAMDERGGIGRDGRIPWKIRSDMKRFKQLTMGHTIVFGRKTFESIGGLLPGRKIYLLSNSLSEPPSGVKIIATIGQAIENAEVDGESELFIGGGREVYAGVLPIATRIYISRIHACIEADVFFPDFSENDWQVSIEEKYPSSEFDEYPYTFKLLVRGKRKEVNLVTS